MNKNIPQLRFKGFKDDWDQRKLGALLTERNEQVPESFEYPLMSFVQGKGVTPKGERYDRSFLVKDTNKKYKKTELDDFIYSSNNLETGSIGFNKSGSAVISPVYSIFYSKTELESQLIGILSTRRDFLNKMIRFRQGVVYGQWRIHEKDFLSIKILVPSGAEQANIVNFFRKLDGSIILQERKLELLKEQKKGFLQKMFPKNDEKVPELRFKGFTDDWEQRKFKDLVDSKDGIRRGPFGSALKKDLFVKESEYVVYEQQNAIYDRFDTRYNITEEKYNELIKFIVEPGDFIMSGAGTIGRISMVPKDIKSGVFNQALIRFRLNHDKTDSKYFLQLMRSETMQRKLTESNPGSAMVNLVPMSEVKEWDVLLPNISEQRLLGVFFTNLDDTIDLHQHKLELLKEQKKAFLQKMFV